MIPAAVLEAVSRALSLDPGRLGPPVPVSGGCINNGARIQAPDRPYFLKWNQGAPPDFFAREAEGLEALAGGPLRTPRVVARGVDWLLLEWIDEGRPERASWVALGRGLAQLHRIGADGRRYGWATDNFIGSLPQTNTEVESWSRFWLDSRLLPNVRRAAAQGLLTRSEESRLEGAMARVPDLVDDAAEADRPSLLHGDLWSGNVLFDRQGRGVILDPAVYAGHREVDLAMARLFGGFPPAFYEGYGDAWPLEQGDRARLPVYQLYPLLVHLVLFGRGYASSLMDAADAVVRSD